ncbi:TetR/AcrR family transcriptional regulator [Pseudomonas nitroreducens]|uniref:TetR/AcrR family transcriptional regulator n=1 Tax=Pseudomonas nitroreducens TaxID=46680 RepID=A0A6G6IW94_PSENT|nr:TetR/AcrR family transcriptional regulator [Pseudomonas nitroreducens]QIE87476.1 TetR/AcrR family transcriptional regulator [Pseudomonas nitroreducens]WEW96201.1 TetR/AcrR family transcriptional regulator [Pseudomonas nitroreducens]
MASREARKDGEATRLRILEAAGELCATLGFGETSNKAVAAKAEVDLASINYHFGSRNGLYQAVLGEARRRFLDIADLQRIIQGEQAAPDKLFALTELVVRKAARGRESWHLRVLAAEALAPSSHGQEFLHPEKALKLTLLKQLFSEITGIPPEDPTLVPCILSVTAPWAMLLIGPRGGHGALRDILDMPRPVVVAQLYSFTLAGLQEVGRQHRQRALCAGE